MTRITASIKAPRATGSRFVSIAGGIGLTALYSLIATSSLAQIDEFIGGNLLVDGSICVGASCAAGEDFGFDTIRIKSADPRLEIQDTSVSSSFPTNDWSIGVANTGVGGRPQFKVTDDSSGQDVIILEGGAGSGVALGSNSIVVPSAVSFGNPEFKRRIVYVADGVDTTDAATKGQLDTFTSNADAAVAAEITALQQQLQALSNRLSTLEDIIGE